MSLAFKKSNLSIKPLMQSFIADQGFPCVGAKTALAKNQLDHCTAGDIFSDEHDTEILHGLYDFIKKYQQDGAIFRSFIALFPDSDLLTEEAFEDGLWQRLQSLHDLDDQPWDCSVSSDSEDQNFSLSLGGKAFYVIGMHPNSSRKARRFHVPALVFNLHEQFERLRMDGSYQQMRQIIRRRDKAFSGSVNPMLMDFGTRSEAIQYSGRSIDGPWKCPFHMN